MRNRILGLALVAACAPSVTAQVVDETTPTTAPANDVSGLQFIFTPGLWMPRLSGTATFGNSAQVDDFSLRNDLQMDDAEPTFRAEFIVRKDQEWQIKAGGFSFSTDSHGRFD